MLDRESSAIWLKEEGSVEGRWKQFGFLSEEIDMGNPRKASSSSEDLHTAARSGDLQTVQSICASNPLSVNSRDKHSRTPYPFLTSYEIKYHSPPPLFFSLPFLLYMIGSPIFSYSLYLSDNDCFHELLI